MYVVRVDSSLRDKDETCILEGIDVRELVLMSFAGWSGMWTACDKDVAMRELVWRRLVSHFCPTTRQTTRHPNTRKKSVDVLYRLYYIENYAKSIIRHAESFIVTPSSVIKLPYLVGIMPAIDTSPIRMLSHAFPLPWPES
jgi:hypothetical protein